MRAIGALPGRKRWNWSGTCIGAWTSSATIPTQSYESALRIPNTRTIDPARYLSLGLTGVRTKRITNTMMEGYQEHRPSAPLDVYVQRMAYANFPLPLPAEQLAPDSYIKLSLILNGEPLFYDGKGERMDWHDGFCGHVPPSQGIIATSEAPVRCIMVNFFPSGFHRLFGLPVHGFNGRMVPPGQLLGEKAGHLYAELRGADRPARMFEIIDTMILDRLRDIPAESLTAMQVVERWVREHMGMLGVGDLASTACMSIRQLQRRFKEEIGLTPKAFSSVVRFNHLYEHMKRTRKFDLDVALACGYYDESHMLKDLTYFLGRAPKRFAGMVRPMVDASLGQV